MKARIAELVAALRRADVPVTVAEAMDAAQAAASAGVARDVLREALAAALIKDERDRPVYLVAFERVFPPGAGAITLARRKRARRGGENGEGGASGTGRAAGASQAAAGTASADREQSGRRPREARRDVADGNAAPEPRRSAAAADPPGEEAEAEAHGGSADAERRLRERALTQLPFRAMTAADVEAATPLVAALVARLRTRLRRRLAPRPTGRLDFRRTIRAAVPRGGVPFERRYRARRPSPPELTALCDLSASTAVATSFFLSLLAPAAEYFRRVRLFGFVDRLVEIEFVGGHVRPAAPIDLMARSDFGHVLKDLMQRNASALGADTVLLVLGDARNNRLPARADLLAAARARVRRLLWLNPEAPERWNTGDSAIAAYAPHADVVVACGTLAELDHALAAIARR